ncbi:unnamed protein product [Paramecium primaurelia]|uniref:Uncharacterized protein n=1 Tax=Paramecium primaurelia TaxID=5886 RepID=A0A8S1K747_PARPR|nr:unnamed protein product [Paramecium primaurelia]
MNSYKVVSMDFTRTDGQVTVKIRPKVESSEDKDDDMFKKQKVTDPIAKNQSKQFQNQNLIRSKYRCSKSDIASLKRLLKRSYNIKEFKEFYKIYGPKLIEIDFGNIELFNVKGLNQYSITELQQFNKEQNFLRWGKLFSINQLSKYNDNSLIQNQIAALQFYNILIRERIFTLRTLRYYKNDKKRKEFPYQYLYIYDLEDCLQFNLQSFQDQASGQIKIQNHGLPQLKYNFFQKQYDNFQFENIIVPFFQVKFDEQKYIQLFFVHFSKSGYKQKQSRIAADGQDKDDQDKLYQCYIFVNFDTSYYSQQQLMNGVQEFAHFHNFELTPQEIQFVNIKSQGKSFTEDYAEYIETEFFLQEKGSINHQMNYIFNQLPKEMAKKHFNDILNDQFIIPKNIESLLEQFFGK